MEPLGNSKFTPQFFDDSSKAWMENKIRCGAAYSYKCSYIHSNQKQCKYPATQFDFCKRHFILLKSQKQFK
jgi:hypothetical protein